MKCPVCKNVFLEDRNLLGNFHVLGCSQCRGYWIRYDDYWNWFTSDSGQETFQDNLTESGAYLPSLESKQAKLCPDCGRILIKYRVDTRLDFYLDHCGYCNGVWLDNNEWELLLHHNLHNKMHQFFTDPWQKKLRAETVKNQLDKNYLRKFGAEDYEKLKKVKLWIDSNDKKSDILAFLMDENPYKL
jgi:Zn-finger nucleic acid-binding protein